MKKLLGIVPVILCLASCGQKAAEQTHYVSETVPVIVSSEVRETVTEPADDVNKEKDTEKEHTEKMLTLTINGTPVKAEWENSESVRALSELAGKQPLSIQMSQYGGFEQVGPLGSSLPRNDKQTTTSAGDIVLYSGSNIVIFYGSNSWSYTRLGKITGLSVSELEGLLGNGDVSLTISLS